MSNFIWMKNEGQWAGLAPEAPARGAIGETQKTGDRRPGSDTELEIANGEGQNLGHPFSPIGELCGYRNSGKWEIVSEVWIRPWGLLGRKNSFYTAPPPLSSRPDATPSLTCRSLSPAPQHLRIQLRVPPRLNA